MAKNEQQPLALSMMEKNKSVKERAQSYFESIRRNIQRDIIDKLIAKREEIEDNMFELSNFTLDTNLNAGQSRMTKDDCEKRFKDIINKEFELKMVNLEIETKQASFNRLFKS